MHTRYLRERLARIHLLCFDHLMNDSIVLTRIFTDIYSNVKLLLFISSTATTNSKTQIKLGIHLWNLADGTTTITLFSKLYFLMLVDMTMKACASPCMKNGTNCHHAIFWNLDKNFIVVSLIENRLGRWPVNYKKALQPSWF